MPSPKPSPTARLLAWLARAVYTRRRWFFYPQAVLVLVSLLYTVRHLDFLTDRNALVGGDKEYHRHFLEFKEEFRSQDDLVVVVESEDMERNRQFVERLGAKLETETNLFSGVFYKGDLALMGRKALLFLPERDLRELLQTLRDYWPFLEQFTRATNLVSLFDLVNAQFRTARRESNAENAALVKALPALERIVRQAADGLKRPGTPPSPGVNALFEGGREAESQMYITFASNRIYLVTAQARRADLAEAAVARVRQLVAETQFEVPGLNVGLTGEPILELDEMAQSQKDSSRATVLSVLLVALIFIFGYHETGRPLKATVCLLVGLIYTMGFTTLVVGHLNILTITFVPILIGLAIDFGAHLVSRYEEELWRGRTEFQALEKAMVFTGMGIFTGALTTAGAFFAMAFTDFRGIQEMGIICGGGMLVCLVPMMTLLPVLLLRGRQNILDHQLGPALEQQEALDESQRARIENLWLRRPVVTLALAAIISACALAPAQRVGFDYNLLHMQSAGLPAVIFQDKLIQSSSKSVLFGAVVAESAEQARTLEAALTRLPSVGSVETMSLYLTEDQSAKLAIMREVTNLAAYIRFPELDAAPVNLPELSRSFFALHGYLTLAAPEVAAEDRELHGRLVSLRAALEQLLWQVRTSPGAEVVEKLGGYQRALFGDVHRTFEAIRNQDASDRLQERDLPPALRDRFIGVSGKHLLQVYPKKDVWGRENQEQFVRELRRVDPKVTGTPVQLLEYVTLLKQSFEKAAVYSLIAIAILVFIHFRRISCVILSLIPVGVGALWTLGVMGWHELPFNPANIMTLPLVVGIGVTNGIHILNRFAEEAHPSILARSTGKAVVVSGLTTIAGFGSLILAEHRGIRSLGYVMATGTATCMVVGLTLLPAILNLLGRAGWRMKRTQRDNAQSTLGREEPRCRTSASRE
jgi:hypothetical protein